MDQYFYELNQAPISLRLCSDDADRRKEVKIWII